MIIDYPILRHVGITVMDIERSLTFYRDILGFEVFVDQIESGDYIDKFSGLYDVEVRVVKLYDPKNNIIELLEYFSHPSLQGNADITFLGCSHFALTLESVWGFYDAFQDTVEFNACPQKSPDGKVWVTFCKDPDGTLIELVEPIDDDRI